MPAQLPLHEVKRLYDWLQESDQVPYRTSVLGGQLSLLDPEYLRDLFLLLAKYPTSVSVVLDLSQITETQLQLLTSVKNVSCSYEPGRWKPSEEQFRLEQLIRVTRYLTAHETNVTLLSVVTKQCREAVIEQTIDTIYRQISPTSVVFLAESPISLTASNKTEYAADEVWIKKLYAKLPALDRRRTIPFNRIQHERVSTQRDMIPCQKRLSIALHPDLQISLGSMRHLVETSNTALMQNSAEIQLTEFRKIGLQKLHPQCQRCSRLLQCLAIFETAPEQIIDASGSCAGWLNIQTWLLRPETAWICPEV
jgi:hypothetical protein